MGVCHLRDCTKVNAKMGVRNFGKVKMGKEEEGRGKVSRECEREARLQVAVPRRWVSCEVERRVGWGRVQDGCVGFGYEGTRLIELGVRSPCCRVVHFFS
jgi:hypothetical protein